jgi:hypothetical protein
MRRVLALFLFALAAPGFAGLALADDVPSPANSTIPGLVRLVGADPFGHPDPSGRFQVVHRDLANNPIPGAHIVVDFSAATDLVLCAVQAPGVAFVPGGVEGITDANGSVWMALLGHAVANAPPSSVSAVRIYADGVLLGYVPVCAVDLDGASGVGGSDLSLWLADFVSGLNPPRSDYNGTGGLGGSDLSLWLGCFVSGASAQSCPSVVTSP